MTEKPDDIPADVWEAADEPAYAAFDASVDLYETGVASGDVRLIIARAILAERERCARIADTVLLWKGMPGDFEANQVAAAIRANVTFPLA